MACQNLTMDLLSQENAWWKSMAASIRWCLNTQRHWWRSRCTSGDGLQQGQPMIYFLLSNRSSHMNSVQRKTYHVFARLLKILWYNWVLCHPQKSPSPTRVNFQLSPATLPRHDWHALSIGPSLSLLSNGLSKKHTLQLIYRWFLNIEPARQIIFWVNPPYIFIE